jgi:hypothetical protein
MTQVEGRREGGKEERKGGRKLKQIYWELWKEGYIFLITVNTDYRNGPFCVIVRRRCEL